MVAIDALHPDALINYTQVVRGKRESEREREKDTDRVREGGRERERGRERY